MQRPITPDPSTHAPLPHDVKAAVAFLRAAIERPVAMHDLVRHCGGSARTLNKHFRAFLGVPPMRYLQRLRLAAAREALLAGGPGVSVTEAARRYRFNHFGRFSAAYRRAFGETPSATLRRASAATAKDQHPMRRPDLPSREKPSLAVLACECAASEPMLRAFADSLPEAIAAALCSVRAIAVVAPPPRRAALRDPQRLARELGARYALIGRALRSGVRLRLILRVVDAVSGHHVWGDCIDGECDRLLELQDRAVAGVMRAIPPAIRGAEIERARGAPPQDLDAHGLAMRALPSVFASQPDAARRALELLHRAIEIDPDYGLAVALAAWCHGQLVMYNGTHEPEAERLRAMQLVRRASILDDDDPLVLAARCAVHTMAREFDIADALVARALASDPTSGWAWGRSAWLRSYAGDSENAIAHFRRALALDPHVAVRANSFAGLGSAHFSAGRYEEAATWLRRALLEQPVAAWPNRSLSVSYARMGERVKALDALDALRRFCPDLTVGQVVDAVPFQPDFLDRLGDGLSGLGLPP